MKNKNIDLTKDELENLLKEQLVEVTFNKVDGEERVMLCTLQDNVVAHNLKPVAEADEGKKKKKEDVISVWDVQADGWRSFRYENVTNVQPK